MGVRLAACHIIGRMIACHHHERSQGNFLDFGLAIFQAVHDLFQIRPAFHRVNIHIHAAHLTQTRLHDRIVGVGNLRRAVRHEQNRLILRRLGELADQRLHRLRHIIRLALLSLPVHERSPAGDLLELILIVLEHCHVIRVFHARNDIQRRDGDPGVALCLELLQCLFRRRVLDALVRRDAVDDDMAREGRDHLHTGMCRLNVLDCGVDGLFPRVFEGRAKAHDHDGILVFKSLQARRLMLQHADLGSGEQCRGRRLDLLAQRICRIRRRERDSQQGRAGKRSNQHFFPVFHQKTPY